jgi:hypothetical protein
MKCSRGETWTPSSKVHKGRICCRRTETNYEGFRQKSAVINRSLVNDTIEAESVVTSVVVAKIAEVITLAMNIVSSKRSVSDHGVESLVAMESHSWVGKQFDMDLVWITAVLVCVLSSCMLTCNHSQFLRSSEVHQYATLL